MWARLRRLAGKEDGQDLVEYALLVALLSVVSLFGLSILRFEILVTFVKLIISIR